MRVLKIMVLVTSLLAGAQYVPSYYRSWLFNDFVHQESRRTNLKGDLKQTLLTKAQSFSLPVTESDIVITKQGSVYRVAVDYRVPIDLLVYSPELKFHVVAAGLGR